MRLINTLLTTPIVFASSYLNLENKSDIEKILETKWEDFENEIKEQSTNIDTSFLKDLIEINNFGFDLANQKHYFSIALNQEILQALKENWYHDQFAYFLLSDFNNKVDIRKINFFQINPPLQEPQGGIDSWVDLEGLKGQDITSYWEIVKDFLLNKAKEYKFSFENYFKIKKTIFDWTKVNKQVPSKEWIEKAFKENKDFQINDFKAKSLSYSSLDFKKMIVFFSNLKNLPIWLSENTVTDGWQWSNPEQNNTIELSLEELLKGEKKLYFNEKFNRNKEIKFMFNYFLSRENIQTKILYKVDIKNQWNTNNQYKVTNSNIKKSDLLSIKNDGFFHKKGQTFSQVKYFSLLTYQKKLVLTEEFLEKKFIINDEYKHLLPSKALEKALSLSKNKIEAFEKVFFINKDQKYFSFSYYDNYSKKLTNSEFQDENIEFIVDDVNGKIKVSLINENLSWENQNFKKETDEIPQRPDKPDEPTIHQGNAKTITIVIISSITGFTLIVGLIWWFFNLRKPAWKHTKTKKRGK